jgi:hypothetical protein
MYDLIIVSKSDREKYQKLTQQTIDSCLDTSDGIKVNVVVVETSGCLFPYDRANHNLLHDGEFNYNRCLNLGLTRARGLVHMLANNDLIFKEGWAKTGLLMYKHKILSASLLGQHTQDQYQHNKIYEGYETSRELSGWLIFARRELMRRMGKLPENSVFWYSDNNYADRLKELNVKHYLLTHARVEHIESQTFNDMDEETFIKFKQR